MTRIGRNPALGSIRFILIVCVVGGFLLGSPLTRITDGEVPYPVGAALSIGLLIALILGITAVLYRPLAWDHRAGTASFGGRTVPLASVTRVVRGLSSGTGAAYLTYRFFSTEGPSVRVLIAGRPMKGLDAGGITELIRFLEAAPIADPARPDGLNDQQAALADALTDSGGKSEVGKRLLVEELHSILATLDPASAPAPSAAQAGTDVDESTHPAADPSAPPLPLDISNANAATAQRPRMSQAEAAELERRWAEDDADAARFLTSRPAPFTTLRFVLILLIVVAALVSAIALIIAVVAESAGGSLLDEDANDLAAAAIVGPALVGVLLYVLWCAAADARGRHLQTTARAWLETRDAEQRRRGLAAPLLKVWTEPAPGTRLARALGFAVSVLGGLAFLIGLALFFDGDDYGPTVAAAFTLIGGAALVAGIVGIVWSVRRRREGNREFVLLAGWRLDPPFVQDE